MKRERRRARRRPVLESFSFFVSLPQKGGMRLAVSDVSELGLGFDADIDQDAYQIPIAVGELLDVHFHLNQTLFLPLRARVVRVDDRSRQRRVGAEFVERERPEHQVFAQFVQVLDRLVEIATLKK